MNRNIIAIDGPAGAGKGTLTAALGKHYGFASLDTGSLYRAITLYLIRRGYDMEGLDPAEAARVAKRISDSHEILVYAKDPEVRKPLTSRHVSMVSTNPELRNAIRQYQVDFGRNPPPLPDGRPARGAIVEGRDITTIIFPDAPVKLYITARAEIKARRRYEEYISKGIRADYDEILDDLVKRDRQDRERGAAAGKLAIAEGAVVIDTSDMTRGEVFETAREIIDSKLPGLAA